MEYFDPVKIVIFIQKQDPILYPFPDPSETDPAIVLSDRRKCLNFLFCLMPSRDIYPDNPFRVLTLETQARLEHFAKVNGIKTLSQLRRIQDNEDDDG